MAAGTPTPSGSDGLMFTTFPDGRTGVRRSERDPWSIIPEWVAPSTHGDAR